MKIKKKILYITSPNLVVYRHRGAEWARGTELVAGGQFFSAWFSFFFGTTVLWASLLALSFSWPNLHSRYKVWLCPSGSPSWSSRLLVEKLLLLSRFSRVRLCVTPQTAAHQAPPSLGFSRQEHWSGLPFPSPVHESEK